MGQKSVVGKILEQRVNSLPRTTLISAKYKSELKPSCNVDSMSLYTYSFSLQIHLWKSVYYFSFITFITVTKEKLI